jgi:hypothetical protein
MNSFNFEPVQFLDIKSEDNPKIDVKDGMLLIHANRGNDRIVISAPLQSVLPTASVAQTKVKRPPAIKPGTILPPSHGAVGEKNSLSKLKEEDVREMRTLAKDFGYQSSFPSRQKMVEDLAKVYGIHWTTVYNIINHKSWKHVTD